jgi:hypothetical protein
MSVELRLLANCHYADLVHICENLRERDRAEIFATRWTDDPHTLAEDTWRLREFAWMAFRDNEPVAVIGAAMLHPTLWTIFAYGTDKWRRVIVTLTRHANNFMKPAFTNSGATRVQCHALETHDDARKWLRSCGMREESVHKNYGKAGETFVGYVWHPNQTHRTG